MSNHSKIIVISIANNTLNNVISPLNVNKILICFLESVTLRKCVYNHWFKELFEKISITF